MNKNKNLVVGNYWIKMVDEHERMVMYRLGEFSAIKAHDW
jgi:hypothetical protein